MPRKFTISPTKLRTYQQCPAKYRLEYVERLGRFFHRARAGFSFGSSLHKALETFHADGGAASVPVEVLQTRLEQSWQSQGYESPAQEAQFRASGLEMVAQYHAAQVEIAKAAPPDVPLPKTLFTEKTLRMELSEFVALSGRVDRIDEHHDGTLEIVDYKSGRDTVSEADVRDALALNLYQLLLKNAFPDRRVFATLIALRTGANASYELTDAERDELQSESLETGEMLRTKDWEHTLPVLNPHCPYCDFLPHCEKFWERQKNSGNF